MSKKLSVKMNRDFIKNSQLGNNYWRSFVLTIVSIIIAVAVVNFAWSLILPSNMSDTLMVNLINIILMVNILVALLAFRFAFTKFHKGSFKSMNSIKERFRIGVYAIFFVLGLVIFFLNSLMTNFTNFQNFIKNFQLNQFLILLILSIISLPIQSYFEELFFRGYLLQFFGVKFKRIAVTIIINSILFGLFHIGYGLSNFISSFLFSTVVCIITLRTSGIEAASGIHTANNLVIALFFQTLSDIKDIPFSWEINFNELFVEICTFAIILWFTFTWAKQNEKKQILMSNSQES
ncbi:membrane protease YdiL (CAAX protease family) [Clostridium algifaecis]|uniref:Membrane protease YdiL (CAAX protease family) n=1 Tax=Clostridium algifaecis TaxID=1472040 RepID=A0ABS4KWP0_9CLOT|nr:type II CAAX endopeptidase family protein [Clostridium algifaecis]MBP2033324.1 membrane protease YdiL (CAAX protease family) [Clostridium algifaecis]